jgi:YD repeat-containing protein
VKRFLSFLSVGALLTIGPMALAAQAVAEESIRVEQGRVIRSAGDDRKTIEYVYDEQGRLSEEKRDGGTRIVYMYDEKGGRYAVIVPGKAPSEKEPQ